MKNEIFEIGCWFYDEYTAIHRVKEGRDKAEKIVNSVGRYLIDNIAITALSITRYIDDRKTDTTLFRKNEKDDIFSEVVR